MDENRAKWSQDESVEGAVEVARILEADLEFHQGEYLKEFGCNIHEADDDDVARNWLESREPTEATHRELEVLCNLIPREQVTALLLDGIPVGVIKYVVVSNEPFRLRFILQSS